MGEALWEQDEPASTAAPLVAIKDPRQHWHGAARSQLPGGRREDKHNGNQGTQPLLGPGSGKEETGPRLPPNEAEAKEGASETGGRKDLQTPYEATGRKMETGREP